jgi:agmatine deiminase
MTYDFLDSRSPGKSCARIREQAGEAVLAAGGNPDHSNIHWHKIANDSAWMRDNGPVYVITDDKLRIQDWGFDAWGGAFGEHIPYRRDDRVPEKVADILGLPFNTIDVVHERGNLEFNGVDTLLLNWSTIGEVNRNPGYSRSQAEADLKQHFGVSRVVFVEGVVDGDLTRGHIDGIARFIDPATVVVPDCTESSLCNPGSDDDTVYDNAARTIEQSGFTVLRDPIAGFIEYRGDRFDANYMNWLVGNGFVITVGFGDERLDQAARSRIEKYFPGRDVYMVEMLESWAAGGGVHCYTNDQQALRLVGNERQGVVLA